MSLGSSALLLLGAAFGAAEAPAPASSVDALVAGVWANHCGRPIGGDNVMTVFTRTANGEFSVHSISGPKDALTSTVYPARVRPSKTPGRVEIDFIHNKENINHAVADFSQRDEFVVERVVDRNGRLTTEGGKYVSSGKAKQPLRRCSASPAGGPLR